MKRIGTDADNGAILIVEFLYSPDICTLFQSIVVELIPELSALLIDVGEELTITLRLQVLVLGIWQVGES